ncbi:MAG: hypothetical protein KU38_10590 [Sulfurovum sp. FS08-3]|nr:MAG: hypothetical protein KU38_10590 [Sulfurovum sp. FS08-3]
MQFKPSKIRQARYKLERLLEQEQLHIAPLPLASEHLIQESPLPKESLIQRVWGWIFAKKIPKK